MTVYETPGPIGASIEVYVGEVRVTAGERTDTVVEVRPTDPANPADMKAAEETLVELAGGGLVVKRGRRWRALGPFGGTGSVDVVVELPAGSRLNGDLAMGSFRCAGTLGDCRLKTALGDIEVEEAATATLTSSAGDVSVLRATGDAELTTASGAVRAGEIGGSAVLKSSNGDCRVDEIGGDLKVRSANGDLVVGRARASVDAATAKGSVRIAVVERGRVAAQSGFGPVDVGIATGTAAWLDLTTGHGRLRNFLDGGGPPEPGEESVEVRVRSGFGDITISRAEPAESVA